MVKALIEKSEVELTDLEKFILFSAIWTHDLGMFEGVAGKFFEAQNIPVNDRSAQTIRDRHNEISAWYLSSNVGEIMKIQSDEDEEIKAAIDNRLRNYVYTINVISQFHRMSEDINDCPRERFLKGEKIRACLLACLLRLGDTLHVDSSRFDRRLYDVLQIGQLDRGARLHWLKSYVVSNVYLDPKNETVFVNIDLPAASIKSFQNNEVNWEESSKNLQIAIISDIFDDVLAVRKTFREYGLPAYSMVKPNITFIPGYSQRDSEEIAGIVSDLGVVFSPNTSKVMEKALDSIGSLCKIKFDRSEYLYNQMNQLLLYLSNVHESRPCHVGLRKITEAVNNIFDKTFSKRDIKNVAEVEVVECQKAITDKINEIRKERETCAIKLYTKCEGDLLNGVENIIVFGYSEMVTKFLEEYGKHHPSWKEELKLYVLECGGKRRFGSSNNIEYNDGVYYALQLSKHNFKNIYLLPDTSFGSLAYNLERQEKVAKSLVLFGVNGIYEESYDCGHTSGHLMIAIVAERFGIPLKVITDSFKIGKVKWNPMLERKTPWLTGVRDLLNDLQKHNIMLRNYLEDRIPRDLITEIIIDGDNIPGGRDPATKVVESKSQI
jgi:translation initiation factor 2B subunit (eIF-2B alpha/beta/delta family)